jgi:phenylpyruvate tautomerase PptA (4-oxalocrotonate tautomerase family)
LSGIFLNDELKERTMPHVSVKLYPGRPEQQKTRLAEQIVKDVVALMKCGEESVSVAIEEIKPRRQGNTRCLLRKRHDWTSGFLSPVPDSGDLLCVGYII